MSKPSVCIIGGGAAGLCSTLYLVRRGVRDVTVVDRAHPAAGSEGLFPSRLFLEGAEPVAQVAAVLGRSERAATWSGSFVRVRSTAASTRISRGPGGAVPHPVP